MTHSVYSWRIRAWEAQHSLKYAWFYEIQLYLISSDTRSFGVGRTSEYRFSYTVPTAAAAAAARTRYYIRQVI
jgi:hypothetical protein